VILLIPLGPADRRLRVPAVTAAIIAVNVLVFLWTSRFDTAKAVAEEGELLRVAEWSLRLAEKGVPGLGQRVAAYDSVLTFLEKDPYWQDEVKNEELRARLLGCLEDSRAHKRAHPFYRYGFIPADVSPGRLLAHQFLHADVLHVGFNMLFLWTVGGLLELSLGAALFLPLYLVGGVAAAFAHAVFHPGSHDPAIGASGAVAAAMGLFAVRHGRVPVRLALVAMLMAAPRIIFLSWPAYVFLGLWLVEQLFMASFGSALGIAFWAHIGGFVFGLLIGTGSLYWPGYAPAADDDDE
jgi:membrane associated rhomboid family serine protease